MRFPSTILGLALFALTLSLPAADPALQVAFIGNSFTEYEDLPGKFRTLAVAAGKTAPVTGKSIYLGHSLENQWVEKNAQITGLIKSKPWTHIVLQDHSTQTYARTATFEKYAKIYHDYIRANCPNPNVKIVWFLTWARFETSLQTNPQYIYGNALELDKAHIIASAYQKMRNLYGDILVPAGIGIDVFRQRNDWAWTMKLTRSETDMNHVRPEGTYLAACTFFGVLYGQSPIGLPLSSDLTMGATVGRGLQEAAWNAASQRWQQRVLFTTPATQTLQGSSLQVTLQAKATSGLQPVFRVVSGPATLGTATFTRWTNGTTNSYANWARTMLTITGPGTVVIGVTQPGDGTYAPATEVLRTIIISGTVGGNNRAPVVNAGADQSITLPASAVINGVISDDGLPSGTLTRTWSRTSGPGTVIFSATNASSTTASFSSAGIYFLRLTASDGALITYDEVQVTATSGTAGQAVTTLMLINADTDQPIMPLIDGMFIVFSELGTQNLSIRADTNPPVVGSVRFSYDVTGNYRTENTAPYSIKGDASGDYHPWTPTDGTHTLTATPYSASNGQGTKGTAHTVRFTVGIPTAAN